MEVGETYVGGRRKNISKAKRKNLEGRGAVGKVAVVGVKDKGTNKVRTSVVEVTDVKTLQGFIIQHAAPEAIVYTDDDASTYKDIPHDHECVTHSVGEYVRDPVHTNGIESFWSMLKRAHKGTFHKLSHKHLQRYVNEFSGRHDVRELDTIVQMESVVIELVGKRLMYRDLIA